MKSKLAVYVWGQRYFFSIDLILFTLFVYVRCRKYILQARHQYYTIDVRTLAPV